MKRYEATRFESDKEIAAYIWSSLKDGISFVDSTLTQEREQTLKYYYGDAPRRFHEGSSSYKSLDVYDSIENARAALLETFTGNTLPIEFVESPQFPAQQARLAADLVNKALFEQNDGFSTIDQVIFDGLTSRVGAVKVYWDSQTSFEEQEVSDIPPEAIGPLDTMVEDYDLELDEATGLYSGTVTTKNEAGQVRIESIAPEDILKKTDSEGLEDGPWGHRVTKRMSVWVAEGYSEEDLEKALTDNQRDHWDQVKSARNDAGSIWQDDDDAQEDVDPEVTLIEAYVRADLDDTGEKLWWILLASDSDLLDKAEIERNPILPFIPLPVPHVFHGASYAKSVIPTQDSKTTLVRSIIDHALRTNNPRYEVLTGTVSSAKELLENRLGGIVNVKRPDGIKSLEQPPLNPFTFQLVQLLDEDLDDTTGVSRLARGVEKDAVSKQNSSKMIEQLSVMSQQRLRIMARRLAETFLKPLASMVYTLLVENEKKPVTVFSAGRAVNVFPSQWPQAGDIRVELSLSPEDREKESGKLIQMISLIQQDPELARMFPPQTKRELAVRSLRLQGFQDAERWFMPQPKPAQPDPKMVAEIQQMKHDMQMEERKLQLEMMKAKTEQMETIAKLQQDGQKLAIEQLNKEWDRMLDFRKQAHNEMVDAEELRQAENADKTISYAAATE